MARYGLAIAKLKSRIAVTHERVFSRKRFLARAYASTGTCPRGDALALRAPPTDLPRGLRRLELAAVLKRADLSHQWVGLVGRS